MTIEWWPEYKCPKCGYATVVTNVCRRCDVWMCATGFEEKTWLDEKKKLHVGRRSMTKDSELYDQAVHASWAFRNGIKLGEWKGPVPDWAWFGESKIGEDIIGKNK